VPVAEGETAIETMPVQHSEPPQAAIGQAEASDRV
jgi:hypothetical protein